MKNSNDTIGNRTRDLPACSAVPQPTAPPRSQNAYGRFLYFAPIIYLNVPTHRLWFKIQLLEHALYKSTPIYLVQATSLVAQFSPFRRPHVWHKNVIMRLSQSDLAHRVLPQPHITNTQHMRSSTYSPAASILAISRSTCKTFPVAVMM